MRGVKPRLVVSNDAVTKIPAPPSWLGKAAKEEWKRVLPDLIARKVITTTDLGALENYCVAMGNVRDMSRLVNRQGHMVAKKPHPLIRQVSIYLESSRRYAAELGLTPVARQRAGGSAPPDSGGDDAWA